MSNSNFNRRQFMKLSALSALGFAVGNPLNLVPSALKPEGVADGGILGEEALAAGANQNTLVFVFCRGAMDTMSFFPPLGGALRTEYVKARPNIKFNAKVVNGTSQDFGVNDKLNELKQLLDSKDMSVVLGVGSINPTFSHFNQMDYIEGGNSKKRLGQGMFQRVKVAGGFTSNTDLVAVESTIPRSMAGTEFVFQYENRAALGELTSTVVDPGVPKKERLEKNFNNHWKAGPIARQLASAQAGVLNKVQDVEVSSTPISSFGEAARLIKAGVSPRVLTLSVGGWDMHSNLVTRLTSDSGTTGLGEKLGIALKEFSKELKAAGKWNNVTVVVMSEFGRRIVENGSFGCDHGRGGHMLILGGKINGGKIIHKAGYANYLTACYKGNAPDQPKDPKQCNVPVDYDYRVILGEVLHKRLGISHASQIVDVYQEEAGSIAGIGSLNLLKA